MNLSVAAVIEGLEAAKSENSGVIEGDDVQALLDRWMEYDPRASGWISVLDFICLVIEAKAPFGNPELNKCKYTNAKDFQLARGLIFNDGSYHVDMERMIVIKNKDIIRVLQSYRVRTYEGHASKVHFKDVYAILVKRAFQESEDIAEDFQVSKHLKAKMKGQWTAKHKKVKGYSKSAFKLHQDFATAVIAKYVRAFKARRAARLRAEQELAAAGGEASESSADEGASGDERRTAKKARHAREKTGVELGPDGAPAPSQLQALDYNEDEDHPATPEKWPAGPNTVQGARGPNITINSDELNAQDNAAHQA